MTLLLSHTDPGAAETAAALIRRGELVALPTETVYGLGAIPPPWRRSSRPRAGPRTIP